MLADRVLVTPIVVVLPRLVTARWNVVGITPCGRASGNRPNTQPPATCRCAGWPSLLQVVLVSGSVRASAAVRTSSSTPSHRSSAHSEIQILPASPRNSAANSRALENCVASSGRPSIDKYRFVDQRVNRLLTSKAPGSRNEPACGHMFGQMKGPAAIRAGTIRRIRL